MAYQTFSPREMETRELYHHLTSAITPRPIALVSTISASGVPNLAPYSFFNLFSINPPVLVFSPTTTRHLSSKDSLQNVKDIPEVVVHTVGFDMVQQVALAAADFDYGVNEFEKAGFNILSSDIVRPPRVEEAPVAFECQVKDIYSLGDNAGSGNLVICEVLRFHINTAIQGSEGRVDAYKAHNIGRLGGRFYQETMPESIFEVMTGRDPNIIGYDGLPESIKNNPILEKNHLGRLSALPALPTKEAIQDILTKDEDVRDIIENDGDEDDKIYALGLYAAMLLEHEETEKGMQVLMLSENLSDL